MIQLAVFDMAGTTVRDRHEVETCFAEAARQTGLRVPAARLQAVQGWAKRFVFETLWQEKRGPGADVSRQVEKSYAAFREILEYHYRTQPVHPTDGCLATFDFLKKHRVPIALTTGFYREVTDLILERLSWHLGLDDSHRGDFDCRIQLSLASDEVPQGRPAPDLILRAMAVLGVTEPAAVVNIGDTPADLASARAAGVGLSVGVTNGTHTRRQLLACPHDELLDSLAALPALLVARGLLPE